MQCFQNTKGQACLRLKVLDWNFGLSFSLQSFYVAVVEVVRVKMSLFTIINPSSRRHLSY